MIELPDGVRLVLASASPRRAELLRSVGLDSEVIPADIAKEYGLSGANLRSVDLRGAHLAGADLSGADLTGALIGTEDNLNAETDLTDVTWTGAICPDGTSAGAAGCEAHLFSLETAVVGSE